MSCTPQDFLGLAKKLRASAEEIERRTAVNRAYYCAFHMVNGAGVAPAATHEDLRHGSHEAVIRRYLGWRERKEAVSVGYILRDMKNRRESADYDLDGTCLTEDAMYQIAQAEKIHTLLGLLAPPASG